MKANNMSSQELSPSTGSALELAGLLARVEAAEGADRELDFDLYRWLNPIAQMQPYGWMIEHYKISPAGNVHIRETNYKKLNADFVPYWSASLDAALALCQRVLPGMPFSLTCTPERPGWRAKTWTIGDTQSGRHFDAQTPALALLAALLKALCADAASPAGETVRGPGTIKTEAHQ